MNSNASRPAPKANTGSELLNFISDAGMALLRFERRFDPFVRPAFDALLRDPLARFTTSLINKQRVNEGLVIAQEKLMDDEESFTDSIDASFTAQMRGL